MILQYILLGDIAYTVSHPSIHPSIIYTHLSWSGSQGVLEPIPACIGREAGIHPGHTHTYGQFRVSN
uniref:Uncharacterized protein n=1 Tax=Anguilla anguilla TaxID=7936 RepID=A0A0E9WMJ8_ANGAN